MIRVADSIRPRRRTVTLNSVGMATDTLRYYSARVTRKCERLESARGSRETARRRRVAMCQDDATANVLTTYKRSSVMCVYF